MSLAPVAVAEREAELRFPVFGTEARILVGSPIAGDALSPEVAARLIQTAFVSMHDALTRFSPLSELSRLNDSTEESVEVSPLLAHAVGAALLAARTSNGLVDPTVLAALEVAGYRDSRVDAVPASLSGALAAAPPRRAATANPARSWAQVEVRPGRWIRRPVGLRLDLGGSAKGLAVDIAAARLAGYSSYAVDAGGDLRLAGDVPRRVEVAHPQSSELAHVFELALGAVCTSGIDTRLWRDGDGYAHHLVDPGTGVSAWTGVIQATALSSSALDAETIAKLALLSGPVAGAEILSECGGVLILDSGRVEVFEPK